jgi:hypothetical protein
MTLARSGGSRGFCHIVDGILPQRTVKNQYGGAKTKKSAGANRRFLQNFFNNKKSLTSLPRAS